MIVQPTTDQAPDDSRRGFDAPAIARHTDHLNRWPLAREIVSIAITGPSDWSVRVGIYGEWGTGKTSVLKFITQIAEKDGHIVVWFDPWEYSSRSDLWRAFVSTVFENLKAKLGNVPGATNAKAREWSQKAGLILAGITRAINDDAGKALEGGLDLVRKHFGAGANDFKEIQPILGNRRVIVLIDDLDRTAPELVPEILFAMKELMDVPGFSFICAFDPVVVGQVLGKFHPGFGDGLKFLDKIIDYPRWLPKASAEVLAKMATADASISCPYVPTESVADATHLLPPNPRAVRQFIRLLSLLKPQIERHYPHELHWAAIIAACVLKVRHPRIAHELLNDHTFWGKVGVIGFAARRENEEELTAKAVTEHLDSVCATSSVTLDTTEKNEIRKALTVLCSQFDLFTGLNEESASYQYSLGEAPHALTWKEFDAFILEWEKSKVLTTFESWLNRHQILVERTENEIYRELLQATIHRYSELLIKADDAFTNEQRHPFVEQAESLLKLLDTLVFENGNLSERACQIGGAQLEIIVEKFARMADASQPIHVRFWPQSEAFITRLFSQWSGDVMPLVKVWQLHLGIRRRNFDGPLSLKLHRTLCDGFLPRLTRQTISSFRQKGFIQRLTRGENDTFHYRRLILDSTSPLWSNFCGETCAMLNESSSNTDVQENAYELLRWMLLARVGPMPDSDSFRKLFSDQTIFDAVWKAATASQLGPRSISNIRELPDVMKELHVNCSLPAWWAPIIATFTVPTRTDEQVDSKSPDIEPPQDSSLASS